MMWANLLGLRDVRTVGKGDSLSPEWSLLTPYDSCDSELLQLMDPFVTGIQTRDMEYTQGA